MPFAPFTLINIATKKLYFPLLFLIISFNSLADTFEGSFGVLASVNNNCAIAVGDFIGVYNPLDQSPVLATQTETVVCTIGTVFHIRINQGLHGADVTHRKLSDGVHTINYSIFRDSARTLNWGETDGVDTFDSVGTGTTQTFTAYDFAAALQVVPPGIYEDTLTVSLNF